MFAEDVSYTILRKQPPVSTPVLADLNRDLKIGIWLYFWLLIFEGALRKWVLPSLATPLLVVRDPIALWLIFKAWQRNLLPSNVYLNTIVIVGVLGIFTAVFFGHGSLPVALFGARILLIQFPVIFVIGSIFSQEDVLKMGNMILWISIPMAVLVALQFYSPQSAWVNRGVGGDMKGAGFSGALGYFRPPGTFSFTSGNTFFYGLVASFLFYFWLNFKAKHLILLVGATLALVVVIPLSISRTLFFSVGITVAFAVMASLQKPKYLGRIILAGIGAYLILAFLSDKDFFSTATKAFSTRFDQASTSEGGLKGTLGNRYLGDLFQSIINSLNQPFFGYGLGMGTNAGAMLLTGKTAFLISEGEWGRLLGEMGPLMGIVVILVRLALSVSISLACYRNLRKGNILPWMLLGFGLLNIPQGQWAPPTNLGFSVLIGGLLLASIKEQPQRIKL